MIREKLAAIHHEKDFRWRGTEIARIEGLSDAVFAFAVTLLVVSLEVPKTFNELRVIIRGFFPFAISFGLLMQVWHEQYRYFRRYNLQDAMSTTLNCVLLFLVLFYVYPLKFLFTLLVNGWMGFGTRVQLPGGGWEPMIEQHQVPQLMAIFSGGYFAVSAIFVLLFWHALRMRNALELNTSEAFDTRVSIGAAAINAFVSAASLLVALLAPPEIASKATILYPILLCPGFSIYYSVMANKKRRITEAPEA